MFNLSLRDEWVNNKKFCHRLSDDEDEDSEATEKASNRLEAVHRKSSIMELTSPSSSPANWRPSRDCKAADVTIITRNKKWQYNIYFWINAESAFFLTYFCTNKLF